MSETHSTWAQAPVLELLDALSDDRVVHQGWSPQCEKEPSPTDLVWGVLKTTAIQDGRFLPEHNKRLPDSLPPRPTLEVQVGDLLLTCAGPRVRCGVPCLVRETRPRLMISGKMYRMRAKEGGADPRFLEAALRTPRVQGLLDGMKTGMSESGMNLTHARFGSLVIPVAPIEEQRRIADKLDALQARVDACRERLDRIPNILKRFRQSVLAAATSQSSSFEAGGKSPWRKHLLADLCVENRVITYGVIKLGDEIPEGVPCLRTSNVRKLLIETNGLKRIASSLSKEYGRTVLQGREVLVNVRGTLGGVAVVPNQMAGWNVSREVAVVPVDQSRVSPEFLAFWIATDEVQRWLTGVQKGVAYTGINIEDLRNLPVELPTLDEQAEIVRRVEALLALADRIEARDAAARSRVDKLTPALLAKAFRGELVPQDAADEPASILLDRIRANSNGTPIKQRRGRPASAKKKTA